MLFYQQTLILLVLFEVKVSKTFALKDVLSIFDKGIANPCFFLFTIFSGNFFLLIFLKILLVSFFTLRLLGIDEKKIL